MKKRLLTMLLAVTMTLTMFTACGGNNTDSSNTNSESDEQVQEALAAYQGFVDDLDDFEDLKLYKVDDSNIPVCIVDEVHGEKTVLFYENGNLYTYSNKETLILFKNGIIEVEYEAEEGEEVFLGFLELRDGEFVEVAATNVDLTKTFLEGKEVSKEEFLDFFGPLTDEHDYLNSVEYVLYGYSSTDVEYAYNELMYNLENKVKR